jgi:hypothetical protein
VRCWNSAVALPPQLAVIYFELFGLSGIPARYLCGQSLSAQKAPVTAYLHHFLLYGVVFVGVDLWLANALMNLPLAMTMHAPSFARSWLAVSGYPISGCLNV